MCAMYYNYSLLLFHIMPASYYYASYSIHGMQQQHATKTTTTDQIGAAHHDTAINVTCVRGHNFLYEHSHHASCIDCCIVLCSLHLGGD